MARIKIENCEVEEVNLCKFNIEDLIEKFIVNVIKENTRKTA
ncbi:hypothetical protein [Clostridium butyricum]|nr:hypothetical protein [Clostridium butyricum]